MKIITTDYDCIKCGLDYQKHVQTKAGRVMCPLDDSESDGQEFEPAYWIN